MAPDNFDIHQPYMHPGYLNLLKHGTPMMLNNSRAGAKDYARWLDIAVDRIKVVHNGMEFPPRPDEQQIAAFRKSHSLPEKAKVVGGILRFSEEKQPQLWIDTAAEVIKTRPDAMAIGFGGGEMLKKMRNYVELLGLQDRVLLPGVTDEAWLAAASMDVFVMTSRKEGFPNVLLEAQGMGVPVVCTATGGMPETYIEGKTGISVPEATPKALARECLLLLDDNNRLQFMGKHAYEHVRKEYNVNRMVEETFRIYETTKSRAISHV
ncbi:MAG: glycosyltransferase [Rhizobiales bacterium]|nr:glycosyltransferase [Hyphomicrobiales bacterium]